MDPVVVVGLGNPGSEYEDTRHNVGFMVIDQLCQTLKQRPVAGKGNYLVASAQIGGNETYLIKPLTYMNNSGLAVVDLVERFRLSLDQLLVVADDFALPLGAIRLRKKGSDGGHNGLYSIIYQLNSDEFPRLRCGIGRENMPAKSEMASFVLSPFATEEREPALRMVHQAADAAIEFCVSGIARAMNRFNSQHIH